MKNKIISNVLFSSFEKIILIASQFLSGIIIIRNLPRTDYGLLGVFAGYFVFLNLFNISIESILLRDFKLYQDKLNFRLENFIQFNLLKSLGIFLMSFPVAIYMFNRYNTYNTFYVFGIIYILLFSQTLVSPLTTYFTVVFNQKKVTHVNSVKILARLLLLFLLFYVPQLNIYFWIEFIVSIFFISIWFYIGHKELKISIIRILLFRNLDVKFLKESVFNYSLWIHFNSVITGIIYKSDPFFLSFSAAEKEVGDYNVALNSSNIANVIPSIFGYQNSVAISNARKKIEVENLTNIFLKLSVYIGLVTLLVFLILGKVYLFVLTGDDFVDNMFVYQICIVIGLLIAKTFASPLVSVINIFGNVRMFFLRVSLPIFICTILTYLFASYFYQGYGLALANIINSFVWLLLIYKQVKNLDFKFRIRINPIQDFKIIRKTLRP